MKTSLHYRAALLVVSITAVVAASIVGCATARTPEAYRDATYAVLEKRNPTIKSCYDKELAANAKASGKVVVTFHVQPETGKIVDAKVDPKGTTAPASLSSCVVKAMDGLAIEPADQNTGSATFSWEFSS